MGSTGCVNDDGVGVLDEGDGAELRGPGILVDRCDNTLPARDKELECL